MKLKHLPPAVLAATVAAVLLGCATPPPAKKEAKAADDDYEWYTPTGSHVAVKVRKGHSAFTVASPTDTISGAQLTKEIRAKGATAPSD